MTRHRFASEALAREEALRCLLCDDSPCRCGCPAGVDPRLFIRRIRFGDLAGAARLLRRGNILYGVSGYVCPSRRTCAAKCTHEQLDRPIDILGLQRFVADWERTETAAGRAPTTPRRVPVRDPARPVAVVGSGPAGLACAAELALRGRPVTVFEAAERAGGMVRRVIPAFRLPEEVVDFEVGVVARLGVQFRLGTAVTDLAALRDQGFAAVFVATGTWAARKLGVPGEELPGVVSPLALLENARRAGAVELGPRVVVIGGGDVALDAARVARRLGAEVTLVYRRSREAMPAYGQEVEEALEEGIEFLFNAIPEAVLGEGRVAGLRLRRVRWDGPGRTALKHEIHGKPLELEAETIVAAVGLDPRPADTLGLPVVRGGWIASVDRHGRTDADGVFAGGDVVNGPGTVVAAVGEGKRIAAAIDDYLDSPADATAKQDAPTKPLLSTAVPGDAAAKQSTPTKSLAPVVGSASASGPCAAPAPGSEVYERPRADLSVEFCGVRFANPFVLAAAPPSDDLEMVRDAFRAGWAGAVLKTTSVEGTSVPLAYPMMSSLEIDGRRVVGLGNIDLISEHHIDAIEQRVAALKREFPDRVVIGSIMGAKKEDWQQLVRRLEAAGADLIECSFSCPQGTLGSRPGAMLGQDVEASRTVAGWVKQAARHIPVVIKLTPQVADVVEVARAVLS
ncbi:MAG: FAD-dependent oxidoreductase, partial [Deltaproteobacteria bacterium]|nr:FAD-dependent oxidoreductase [Deltaproteobacteria bacterium]